MRLKLAAAAMVICVAALTVAYMPTAAADPTYDEMANNAFIRLLAERNMLSVTPIGEKPLGPQGGEVSLAGMPVIDDLIESGRTVCSFVIKGVSDETIKKYLWVKYDQADMWNTVFMALSIRTFCPPTPADRSW